MIEISVANLFTTNAQRKAFEDWVKTVGDGIFARHYMNLMWEAWQAAQSLQDGWQPIESAPKDGTKVIICSSEYSPIVAAFKGSQWEKRAGSFVAHLPTHWMPLPAAPQQKGKI